MQPVANNACNENTELSAGRNGGTDGGDKCMNEDINGQTTTEDGNSEMINKNTTNSGLTNDGDRIVTTEDGLDDKGTGVEDKESLLIQNGKIESETDRTANSNSTNRESNVGSAELTNDGDKTSITGEELEKNENVADEDSELREKTEGPQRRRFLNFIDSDSEDEPVLPATVDKERVESEDEDAPKKLSSKQKYKSKKKKVFSDSENEEIFTASKKSKSKKKKVVSSVSKEDNGNDNRDDEKEEATQTTLRFQTLVDSESEGEERTQTFTREVPEGQKSAKKVKEKKRKGSIRAAKEEAMKEIHSETQRLLREREVSLPYHVPKQRTLEEFLSRKKVSAALPKAPTMAAKLKMSSVIVNEVLEEKEKEAELFYKSSDSEDENTQNTVQQKSEDSKKDSAGDSTQNFAKTSDKDASKSKDGQANSEEESPVIEATQKLTNQVQDFHKKKEIIQQGNVCLGAPRKLFDADCLGINDEDLNDVDDEIFNDDFTEKTTDTPGEEDVNPENRAKMILKSREQRKDRREGSVPRKLLGMLVETEETEEPGPEEEQSSEKGQPSNNAEEPNQSGDIGEIIETPHVNKKDLVTSLDKSKGQNFGGNGGDDEEMLKLMSEELEDMASDTDVAKNKEDSGLSSMNSDLIKLVDQIENEDAANGLGRADEQANDSSKSNKDAIPEESSSYANTVRNCLGIDKLDDYNEYGLPPPVFDEDIAKSEEKQENKRSSIKAKLLSKLPASEPKIKGNPGMMIDLTADVKPRPEGVDKLLDRFFCKHAKAKNKKTENSDVSVICVEETSSGPVATKQKLPYKLPETKVESKELCKPGAKLQRLKEELELKMAMRRDEEWKLKEEEMRNDEDTEEEEELLLEDKVEEMEDDEEEAETEPEEDDIVIKERKRKRCDFADDEAEVSEGDGEDDFENDEQSDRESTKEKKKRKARGNSFADIVEEVEGDTEELEEDDEDEDEDDEEVGSRRKLKRIIKPFEEDSNMSNATSTENEVEAQRDEMLKNSEQTDTLSRYVKEKEDGNGEDSCKNEKRNVTEKKEGKSLKHIMDFFKSDIKLKRKDEKEEDEVEQYMALSQKVREKTSFTRTTTDTDIFTSENEEAYAQDKELEFTQTPLNKGNILDLISPATQLSVLSAKLDSSKKDEYFSGKSTVTPMKRMSLQKKLFDDSPEMNEEDLLNLCSGKFSLERMNSEGRQQKDGKQNLYQTEEPEMTDSQLIALCSGPFGTSVSKQSEKRDSYETNDAKEQETVKENPESGTGLRLVSSDEDEEESVVAGRRKKRTWKKLDLSDESEEENSSNSEEEEEEEMNENFEDPEDEEKFVDYDSEENEVIVVPKKDMKRFAAGFLENEAELSGEEDYEGSDDEDERGLDQLELEEGDAEEIDEDKMRNQLGKLHMKQILDEDQRDVRILKEILFEDGDLHTDGSGRERKFRWKNIDKLGEEKDGQVTSTDKDGWLDVPEDENEIEWRKMRHEREKFLAEKKKELDDEIEAELNDCEIFKLGVKALKKIEINQSLRQSNSSEISEPTQPKTCHTISDLLNTSDVGGKSRTIQSVMQRRSLLARSEESLARIAMLARQNEPSILAKNARNFVFKHISPSIKEEEENNSENIESKFEETNPSSKYRKRKATSNATPRAVKKTKMEVESRGKKLF